MTQREDMIGDPALIGMVALDREVGTMVEQAVEDMRRLAGPGGDDPGMERCIAVGGVRVKGGGGIAALDEVERPAPSRCCAKRATVQSADRERSVRCMKLSPSAWIWPSKHFRHTAPIEKAPLYLAASCAEPRCALL